MKKLLTLVSVFTFVLFLSTGAFAQGKGGGQGQGLARLVDARRSRLPRRLAVGAGGELRIGQRRIDGDELGARHRRSVFQRDEPDSIAVTTSLLLLWCLVRSGEARIDRLLRRHRRRVEPQPEVPRRGGNVLVVDHRRESGQWKHPRMYVPGHYQLHVG